MKRKNLLPLVLSSFFLALGLVLPFLTAQVKEIGDTLLPMHLPVLLCGALCGWKYGFTVGIVLPLMRSFLFSMPPLYPNAIWMMAELAAYGLFIGLLYKSGSRRLGIYPSLLIAMLSGRVVWGVAKSILLGVGSKSFTVATFIAGGFVDALPGIILQLILVPLIVKTAEKIYKKRN